MTKKFDELIEIETDKLNIWEWECDSFKAGAKFVSENPTMIESVRELILQVDNALDEIAEYQHISEHTHDLLIKACMKVEKLEKDL